MKKLTLAHAKRILRRNPQIAFNLISDFTLPENYLGNKIRISHKPYEGDIAVDKPAYLVSLRYQHNTYISGKSFGYGLGQRWIHCLIPVESLMQAARKISLKIFL